MYIWTEELPYFGHRELATRDSDLIKLDSRFAAHLPALRATWGLRLVLTSCCRTMDHNIKVGGHPRSLHLINNPHWPTAGCMAADIAWETWASERKLKFARLAYSLGWSVGLHESFIHVDRRIDLGLEALPQRVFKYAGWKYEFMGYQVKEKAR
jgi:hypothetical protein